MRDVAEYFVLEGVQWLRLAIELIGAVVVAMGVFIGAARFAQALWARKTSDFTAIRLVASRYLALGLEFQLGADILSTAVAPTWDQIGKLAAIATIRTVLNYFLSREMREEQRTAAAEHHVESRAAGGAA
jgi:uncharacterized membrane protein